MAQCSKIVLFITVLCLISSLLVELGACVQMSVTPQDVTETRDKVVNITCVVGDVNQGKTQKGFLVLEIFDSEGIIASIREGSIVTMGSHSSSRFSAVGRFFNDSSASYLTVSLSQPERSDSGVYRCNVFYLSEDSSVAIATKSINITITEYDVTKVMNKQTILESVLVNLLDRSIYVDADQTGNIDWVIGITDQEKKDLSGLVSNILKGSNFSDIFGVSELKSHITSLEERLANLTAEASKPTVTVNHTAQVKAFNNLKDRVDHLENVSKENAPVIHRLVESDVYLNDYLDQINDTNIRHSKRVDTLAKDVDEYKKTSVSQSRKLQHEIQQNKDKVNALSDADALIREQINGLASSSMNQSKILDYLQEKENFQLAFAATNDNRTLTIHNGETLIFPDVLTLEGQGYNANTGVFTASRHGVYVFYLTVHVGDAGAGAIIHIVVNTQEVARLYARQNDHRDQSSVSAVVSLQPGDQVKAQVIRAYGDNPYLYKYESSVFGGYLVKLS